MRLYAIINGRAGSIIDLDHAALASRLRASLSEAGHSVEVDIVEPDVLQASVAAVAASKPDVIVVGGGDGSVRAAASVLIDSEIALGILPLGTLNRLARDLNIPLDIDLAARALAHGSVRQIDTGELNGSIFVCNSLIGLPPLYARQRQKQRGQPLRQRLVGYASTLRHILRSRRKLIITLDDGEQRVMKRALSIAVSNNVYADQAGLIPQRPALDRGELGIYVASHDSGWALAFAFVRAMLGYWRSDPKLDETVAHRVQIYMGRRKVRVANDGELEIYDTPLKYRSRPKALRVLAPDGAPGTA